MSKWEECNNGIEMRAWDEGSEVMHYDFQSIQSGNEDNDWIIFISDKQKLGEGKSVFKNPYFARQFKKMLYTGIHGFYKGETTKVYVGDRVKMEFMDDLDNVLYTEYNIAIIEDGLFTFAPSQKHRGLTHRDFWDRYRGMDVSRFKITILDNIYQIDEQYNKLFDSCESKNEEESAD